MNILKILLLGLLFVSCISAGEKPMDGMTRKWIRSTIKPPYLGPKLSHLMSPVFLNELVIQGNGHGSLVAIDADSGRISWKFNAKHGVHGATVLGDKLFFGTEAGWVVCLDNKGNQLWDLKLEAGVYSKPTIHENFLYLLTGDNAVYSINLDTKNITWTYSRNSNVSMSVLGSSSPIPYKDILLVGLSDGYLVTLNQKSGLLVWEKKLNTSDKFKDIDGMALDGDMLYVSNFDADLLGLNAKDGSLVWKSENSGGGSDPTVAEDIVLISSSNGGVEALKKATGEKLWTFKLKSGFATKPLVSSNTVYFGQNNGPVVGLDIRDGKQLFSYAVSGTLATPSISGNTLYLISNAGNLNAINTNTD